ncbi:MAG TPA: thiamine phosphate synthase [Vicinamibacterales bacterium]|nr:thiamine phosphate synthase [Vicinamibacterales bacterium]
MRPLPRLYPVVDVELAAGRGWEPVDLARAFLEGGARLLQLRAKNVDSSSLLALADRLMPLARAYGADVIVNDRADVARMAGAAGVHVGQEDITAREARRVVGPEAIVGLSTHTLEQVEAAASGPVSYIAVGPVFGTTTKDTGYTAVGLELITAAAARAGAVPIVGIGGIDLDRAPAVLAAGAASVAVISDLLTPDPTARIRQYIELLGAP